MRRIALVLTLCIATVGLAACESAPEAKPRAAEPTPEAPPPFESFSADRAWMDLEALVGMGPRFPGSEGGAQARAYLRAQLAAAGLETEEVTTTWRIEGREETTLRHLVATLPGASPMLFLLVAPYDSSRFEGFEFVGANDGASGASLLLELGRVLSTRSLPYTTRLVFLDGEGRFEGDAENPPVDRWHGSAGLADQMQQAGELERIRLLVALNQVCDADLRIARDLSSHRMYREEFFKVAPGVGHADAFPRDQGFESPAASHLAFRDRGVRATLALVDTRYGGDASPGVFAESADDTLEHCAVDSLDAVGRVTLEALDRIGSRLTKIDRFARSPLTEVVPRSESEEPVGDPAGE